ncbi:MAG: hypothetical protein FWH11_09715 [Micrococcales bacterium]|nr:hypothetical protein [Micrococcales bacterium]
MADRIAVDANALVHHAVRVERVSDDVRAATDTARRSVLGTDALGPLCSFLLLPTQDAATVAQATITSASTMVEWTGQRARVWAQHAADAEQRALDRLRTLHASLV